MFIFTIELFLNLWLLFSPSFPHKLWWGIVIYFFNVGESKGNPFIANQFILQFLELEYFSGGALVVYDCNWGDHLSGLLTFDIDVVDFIDIFLWNFAVEGFDS